MSRKPLTGEKELDFLARLAQPTRRRTFLKWSGVSVAVAVAGCSDRDSTPLGPGQGSTESHDGDEHAVDLGDGDGAVLNYAYALEQLEADFYIQVVAAGTLMGEEAEIMDDIRAHEVVHRDYLAAAIPALGFNPIPELEFIFESVDFSSRDSILTTARIFEDLGVSAYNGAAQLIENVAVLGVAGKIVSVEARHASVIRQLIMPNSGFFAARVDQFGDRAVVNEQGLDVVRLPAMVLEAAAPFFAAPILEPGVLDTSGLPEPAYNPPSPTAPIPVG